MELKFTKQELDKPINSSFTMSMENRAKADIINDYYNELYGSTQDLKSVVQDIDIFYNQEEIFTDYKKSLSQKYRFIILKWIEKEWDALPYEKEEKTKKLNEKINFLFKITK